MANLWSVAICNDIVMEYSKEKDESLEKNEESSDNKDNILRLIHQVFCEKITLNSVNDYARHVILCLINLTCKTINNRIIDKVLEGESTNYFSYDEQITDENEQ